MTKTELIKKISEEIDMSRPEVRKVVECLEDWVLEIIATEDFIDFEFARIEGFTKPPWRITGLYRAFDSFQKNGHWSDAKVGYPKCTFTKVARDYLSMNPHDYFEQPEQRYTTKARQFRKDNNLEEISEYQDLPEEEIKKLCKKADYLQKGPLTAVDYNKLKRMDRVREKHRKEIFLLMQHEDLQKQRESGVKEEDLVYKTHEELAEQYYAIERERQKKYLEERPFVKKIRKRLEDAKTPYDPVHDKIEKVNKTINQTLRKPAQKKSKKKKKKKSSTGTKKITKSNNKDSIQESIKNNVQESIQENISENIKDSTRNDTNIK